MTDDEMLLRDVQAARVRAEYLVGAGAGRHVGRALQGLIHAEQWLLRAAVESCDGPAVA
jgi:hypothetical protein